MSKSPPSRPSQSGGFALIEVLVSVLIFSLGVVGLMGVQTRALQVSNEAQDRNTAAMLANSITSEMWLVKSTSVDASVLSAWQDQVAQSLPNGEGTVTTSSASNAVVSVTWLPPARSASEPENAFKTSVVIPQ